MVAKTRALRQDDVPAMIDSWREAGRAALERHDVAAAARMARLVRQMVAACAAETATFATCDAKPELRKPGPQSTVNTGDVMARARAGESHKSIARYYNVTRQRICQILGER